MRYEPKGDGGKRRTGGWKRIIPDIEFMVRREGERAGRAGRGLWLWGFSMVRLVPRTFGIVSVFVDISTGAGCSASASTQRVR